MKEVTANQWLREIQGWAYCLQIGDSVVSKGDAEQIQCALLNHGWLSEHVEDGDVFVGGLNSVFDDRRQIADQSLKAVDLHSVNGLFGKSLALGGGGALRDTGPGRLWLGAAPGFSAT